MAPIKPVPGQMKLPRELQMRPRDLTPRTPHPMVVGDPGWITLGKRLRELRPRTPAIGAVESTEDAVARFRWERVKQGFPEQVVLPWP